jgi:NAD(P)-dependent dehydrogenase (short-subunit alcohol dehydrogenase family)
MRFEGRTAVITGAGSGMGKAMVERFHAEGANVVAADIDGGAAARTVSALNGGRALSVPTDVSDAASVDALAEAVLEQFGRVDVVCNNAGVLDDYTPAHETSDDLWRKIIGVNLTGPFNVSRRFVQVMLPQGKGVIVNTASISAFIAGGGGAAYTASKHGVLGLTRQLAFDYGGKGIRVNAICPGATATGMTSHLLTPEGRNEHVDQAIAGTPAGRWAKPEEIASLAAFLASDDADFIHGAAYMIDGGWTLP